MVRGMVSANGRRVLQSVLDVDDELAAAVPASQRAAARRMLRGPEVRLSPGPARSYELAHVAAVYVVGGVLVREVALGAAVMPEIIGAGDLLRPRPMTATLDCGVVSLQAIKPVVLLALDDRLEEAACQWPALRAIIDERAAERHDRAMLVGAIGHLPRVEQRVVALLWLLATEWGRVGVDGFVVPFPLTHSMIGRFIGAARSTVSLAISDLTAGGLVRRRIDRSWLLPADSDRAARDLLGMPGQTPVQVLSGRAVRRRSADLRRAAHRTIDDAEGILQESEAVNAEARQARRAANRRATTQAT